MSKIRLQPHRETITVIKDDIEKYSLSLLQLNLPCS